MGKGGHNKKPTRLKVLRGTAKKCRTNPSEPPVIPSDDLRPPPQLDVGRELQLWEEIATWLHDRGLFEEATRDLAAAYCREMTLYWECVEQVKKEGATQTNLRTGNEYQHPACIIGRNALASAQRVAASFGLTLTDRSGVSGAQGQKKRNEFEGLG